MVTIHASIVKPQEVLNGTLLMRILNPSIFKTSVLFDSCSSSSVEISLVSYKLLAERQNRIEQPLGLCAREFDFHPIKHTSLALSYT